jgi:hypothetical protein
MRRAAQAFEWLKTNSGDRGTILKVADRSLPLRPVAVMASFIAPHRVRPCKSTNGLPSGHPKVQEMKAGRQPGKVIPRGKRAVFPRH